MKNLKGERFGKLIALSYLKLWDKINQKESRWVCICDCGKTTTVVTYKLTSGHTKSCGCFNNPTIKHYLCNTPEYYIWQGMKDRCYNENNSRFYRYGGRGISVCDRWRESFINFYADMGDKPTKNHSIDRIDNNGNYCPENCRWATQKEQCRNQEKTILLTIDGITRNSYDWADLAKVVPSRVIRLRKKKGGMSDYECVFNP